jgi:nucleoside-diphosphate-sugar epimerase
MNDNFSKQSFNTCIKKILVLGGGGFIGNHMVQRLKSEGHFVRAADLKFPDFSASTADEFMIGDLSDAQFCRHVIDQKFDEVYQLAADMGGAGYIFTGLHDADIMCTSSSINVNVLKSCVLSGSTRIFFSSSACVYPQENQRDPLTPVTREDSVYPANPDSEYGWEKLFSERLYLSFARNYGLNVRIARYHNIFGPFGQWVGGKEKAPAAICRKVAMANDQNSIEIWGDGMQTRSFLYIDECLDGSLHLMRSDCSIPLNIGSAEMVSINKLVQMVATIANKSINISHISGPLGVAGRNSDNNLIKECIGWSPTLPLEHGLRKTYDWINQELSKVN